LSQQKILLACYEVPGWGGASTSTYTLFEMLQAEKIDITLVNIIGQHDSAYLRYRFGADMGNPRKLPQVHNCQLLGNNYQHHAQLLELINAINPDAMVGVGWPAAFILKAADPERKLVYITTGCGWMGAYAGKKPGNDLRSLTQNELLNPKMITLADALEERTIAMSDLVVNHSDINQLLYRTLYPGHVGKMYGRVVWFSEWIYQEALRYQALGKRFHDREIDALFVANDWSRQVKNFSLVKKLIKRLKGLNLHIVGEMPELLGGCTHHDFIATREYLFALMANTRVVVSASAYDAAPGILFEAAAMGCNIVTSKNCGNWELCHPDLLADSASAGSFASCIQLATARYYANNIAWFNEKRSYDDLKNLLTVF
jgi:glycosyltransferase involved in cell wall biosynthesis